MNIAIIGTGYVGLVSGVCLASKGHKVMCVDIREDVVNNLNKGVAHIHEKDLEPLLNQTISNGCFKATTNLHDALDQSNIVILAVGTPSENGKIDLTQIKTASAQIGKYLKKSTKFLSIVVKSTVIPTTTDTIVKNIIEQESGKILGEFGLGMNPEFLKEGEAIADFINPDRVVIGYEDELTKQYLEEIYLPWDCDKICVNTRTAEMIKYTNNTLLACLISINNELANVASTLGNIDYNNVIKGVISDKRWSPIINNNRITPSISSYFTPGAGFGGSCFPKDVQAIRTQGEELGVNMAVTNAVLDINKKQASRVIDMLGDITKKKVLLLGLAFKPGTDDLRESSAINIMSQLLSNNADVIAHDPIAMEHAKKQFNHPSLQYTDSWENKVNEVDIIVIGTNWSEYLELKNIIRNNITIFDTKRLFSINDIPDVNYLTFGYSKIYTNE
jgi:UDPglucose 6-dehydrogenase/GDP-mannose 6-dehydrogenase